MTEVSLNGINTSRKKREVLPMSPVQNVTYLSGRTFQILQLKSVPQKLLSVSREELLLFVLCVEF
jgi:hypothetical protein